VAHLRELHNVDMKLDRRHVQHRRFCRSHDFSVQQYCKSKRLDIEIVAANNRRDCGHYRYNKAIVLRSHRQRESSQGRQYECLGRCVESLE
jgi:hypothetical protein